MDESLVFFGSGPVAAESLRLLAKSFVIEAVITKPKPAHHHGSFPVIDIANDLEIPIFTVSNKSELDDLIDKKPVTSTLGVLIDFGIIVSQKVIDYFPLGIVNSHFSILPEWRGADPITFSILSGQKSTGVSLMLLVEKMDEGPLLAYGLYDMPTGITTPRLTEHLIQFSYQLLTKELPNYVRDHNVVPQSTTKRKVSYSRKLTKIDGVIDWNKPAIQIEREIRAYIEWPKSRTNLAGKDVIIVEAHAIPTNDPSKKPGDIEVVGNALMIECGEGYLCIDKLKPAGKNEMTSEAFIAGHKELL